MSPFQTPVVLVLFNRPERLAEVVSVLREVRPRSIFAVADGPRAAREPGSASGLVPRSAPGSAPQSRPFDDVARCEAARAVLDTIDWECEIERDFAESNLGCDDRIRTGLDRVFSQVDRAIVLEDDVVPDPSFLTWAEAMLQRYGDDPSFSIASGCNKLGRWGEARGSHFRAVRGSIWGWATVARVWQAMRALDLADAARREAANPGSVVGHLDSLVARQCRLVLGEVRAGHRIAWDTEFSARTQVAGLRAAISTVNLISNRGIGADATRTTYADDFVATLARQGSAPPDSEKSWDEGEDAGYDRASLLVEFLGRCVNPEMSLRLARMAAARPDAPIDEATRLHLEPFLAPAECLDLLEHLAAHGVDSPQFERVRAALRRAVSRPTPVHQPAPVNQPAPEHQPAPEILPVTAIIAVRNGAAHLARALDSVRAARPRQTIVIDGGSTDGSADLARAAGVRVVAQRSRGLAAARNEALTLADEPFVAFCDADDRWAPGGLEALHRTLAASPNAHAAIGLVMPEALPGQAASRAQQERIGTPLPGFTPGALLARRELFDTLGGFDEALTIGADSDWFVRLVQSGLGPLRIPQIVLHKGMRGTSLSADVERYRKELLTIGTRYLTRRRRGST